MSELMHSIVFGDGTLKNGKFKGYDTYNDWHLIPTSRPTIAMPGIETKFVSIPGMDGAIDLSDFIRKDRPAYANRAGTFEFKVENDHEFWMTIYPRIVNQLHGRKFKMVLNEDDPDYYWDGRFTVDKYDPGDGKFSVVSISYQVSPFKTKIRKNSQGMVWDNFNFERDYDYDPSDFENVIVNGTWTKTIFGEGAPFQLEVTCNSGSITAKFGGETKAVPVGETVSIGRAVYGNNTIKITGNGSVSIDWRGGGL